MFYDDPEVLAVSMHESGRYLFPGTGEVRETGWGAGAGFTVNVPLEPFTDDESWISCFEAVVPGVLRAFEPDLILSQNGCDGHALDPLTHLSATTHLYEHVPRRMHDLSHELCGGRWVATGGGGYDIWRVVPRAWTALWAAVSHQETPQKIPETWLAKWSPKSPVGLPSLMCDDTEDYPQKPRAARMAARNETTAQEVLGMVLPKIR
jgi:acetoin utilization protein AcuC